MPERTTIVPFVLVAVSLILLGSAAWACVALFSSRFDIAADLIRAWSH